MTRYERVRISGKKARTVYLENPAVIASDSLTTLTGYAVTKEAERVSKKHDTLEMIELSLVSSRTPVYYNGKYGTLEDEKWEPK
jgi:hypothetical protein